MAYEKKEWKNRVVEKPMTFVATSNLDGTVTLQPKEGKVAEEGTPIDAENMNRIEQGISDIDKKLGVAQELTTNAINEVKKNLDDSNTRLSESIKNSASNAQNGINELRNQLQQPTKIPTSQPSLVEGSIWIS